MIDKYILIFENALYFFIYQVEKGGKIILPETCDNAADENRKSSIKKIRATKGILKSSFSCETRKFVCSL